MKKKLVSVCILLVTVFASVASIWIWRVGAAQSAAISPSGLHVSGNKLLNGSNQVIRPLGVNRSGSEYMCTSVGATGVFDGPSDSASISAMANWHINTVRVPLNEDCWLGINGYPASKSSNGSQLTAAQYQQAIVSYVNLINSFNLVAILDLHWSAPGGQQSNQQTPMPDLDHAPTFWASVANTFKSNSAVIFDLYNEPFQTTNWQCWRNGSTSGGASPCNDVSYAAAGMQTLVSAVRATGATNVLLLGGLAYSNDISGWLSNKPNDPQNNLAASVHTYNFNACSNTGCFASTIAPVAAQVPVITGEMGENDCAHGFIDMAMAWFDQQGVGYLGWGWDTYNCNSFPALITSYDGTPTAFGVGLRDHLIALDSGSGSTPTPSSTSTPGATPTMGSTPTPTPSPTATATPGTSSCKVQYTVNQWPGGMSVNIVITNAGSTAITGGWTLKFTFPAAGQSVTQGWNGVFTQSGQDVTVTNASWNGTLAAGSSVYPGFNGTWTASNPGPNSFTLNGITCSAA
jgi:hypothetical protein